MVEFQRERLHAGAVEGSLPDPPVRHNDQGSAQAAGEGAGRGFQSQRDPRGGGGAGGRAHAAEGLAGEEARRGAEVDQPIPADGRDGAGEHVPDRGGEAAGKVSERPEVGSQKSEVRRHSSTMVAHIRPQPAVDDIADGAGLRPAKVMLSVDPKWARLLTRLQQLEKSGAVVLLDLGRMSLAPIGKTERLAPELKSVLD